MTKANPGMTCKLCRMGYGHSRRAGWVHGPPIRNTCGPPHGRGWLGSGSSRPTACTPGLHTQHAAPGTSRGGLCRRGCPTKPYFSRRPRGGSHIFYMGVQTNAHSLDPPQSPKSDRICIRPPDPCRGGLECILYAKLGFSAAFPPNCVFCVFGGRRLFRPRPFCM